MDGSRGSVHLQVQVEVGAAVIAALALHRGIANLHGHALGLVRQVEQQLAVEQAEILMCRGTGGTSKLQLRVDGEQHVGRRADGLAQGDVALFLVHLQAVGLVDAAAVARPLALGDVGLGIPHLNAGFVGYRALIQRCHIAGQRLTCPRKRQSCEDCN